MDISKFIKETYSYIAQEKIVNALSNIQELLPNFTPNESWQNEVHNVATTYGFLLSYSMKGIEDPQQKDQIKRLIRGLFKILDEINLEYNKTVKFSQYYTSQRANLIDAENFITEIKKYLAITNFGNLAEIQTQEYFGKEIFDYCWLGTNCDLETQNVLFDILQSHKYGRNEQNLFNLVIGGFFLSLIETFNERKLTFLIKLYLLIAGLRLDDKLRIKTILYICLALYMYRHRIQYYPAVTELVNEMVGGGDTKVLLRGIFKQLHKSKNTEKTTKMVQEGLMASLKNIPDDFVKKMGDNITAIDLSELDLNPEWERMMHESGVTKNIEKLNELKENGGDILLATFENLKFYSFFQSISNWFLPFDVNHSCVNTQLSGNEKLKSVLLESRLLCDNDKYSLALSMANLQQSHVDLMCAQFGQQQDAYKASESDFENISKKYLIETSVQDLYRFCKLYSKKSEFVDFFKSNLNLQDIELLKSVLFERKTLLEIAENNLINEQYEHAITFYKMAESAETELNIGIYQKIGYCYQSVKNYAEALKYYLKCNLINDADLWNLRHIAICYKNCGKYDLAVDYYNQCLQHDGENIQTILQLGQCYYMLSKYQEALNCYYKVNYLKENDVRALRPIAWMNLIMGNLIQSEAYYEKLNNRADVSGSDMLNMGHLQTAKGDLNKALKYYSNALNKLSEHAFIKQFSEDISSLLALDNITQKSMSMILETVLMKKKFSDYMI